MTDNQKTQLAALKAKKTEDLTDTDKALLDALEGLETAEAKGDKTEERYNGLQTRLDSINTELGETRKQSKAIEDLLKDKNLEIDPPLGGDDNEAEKLRLAKLKTDADAIQAKLGSSKEGIALLDIEWEDLTEAGRKKLKTDDEFRLQIYRAAESKLPSPPAKRPWDASAPKKGDDEDDVDKLFKKNQQQNHRRAPNKKVSAKPGEVQPENFDPSYTEEHLVADDRCH